MKYIAERIVNIRRLEELAREIADCAERMELRKDFLKQEDIADCCGEIQAIAKKIQSFDFTVERRIETIPGAELEQDSVTVAAKGLTPIVNGVPVKDVRAFTVLSDSVIIAFNDLDVEAEVYDLGRVTFSGRLEG